MIPTKDAQKMGAIGLFEDTYQDTSKIYFIGGNGKAPQEAYSIEFCGGPHVAFTGEVKSFKIIKQESLGKGYRRLYAVVG
jgi:alanyl-tRNA synthetase